MQPTYLETDRSSNPILTSAAEHLEIAGDLLDLEARDLISGRQSVKLRQVADKLRHLAGLFAERRPA